MLKTFIVDELYIDELYIVANAIRGVSKLVSDAIKNDRIDNIEDALDAIDLLTHNINQLTSTIKKGEVLEGEVDGEH